MGRTPDAADGPRIEEAIVWEEQTSDPVENLRQQYVQGKGLVILEDGIVQSVGEGRHAYTQPPVDDRDVDTPPGSPTEGDRVIVGSSPTGDFVGHAQEIAQWSGSAWIFTTPRHGMVVFVRDENEPYKQTATTSPWTWSKVDTQGGGALPTPDQLGQMLYSATSAAFTKEVPVTTEDGFIVVTDDGFIVTV